MTDLENLSIVIVTWKGDELLRNCLTSLASACGAAPEIVVVDNANQSTTREIVKQFPNATYVAIAQNLGFAGGNNVGLRYCHRAFVALLNNDTVVHDEPFTKLISYLENHAKVAVVQGTMAMPLQDGRPDACGASLTYDGFPVQRLYRTMADPNVSTVTAVYSAKGALMVFRRDLPEKVGGLFHDFFHNNHEEFDFCARSWLTGHEVHYVPTPPIDHLCGQSMVRLDRVEMNVQALYNNLFLLLTVLSAHYVIRVVSGWILWSFIYAFCIWIRQGNSRDMKMFVSAVSRVLRSRKLIREVRRKVQSLRVVSDSEIFRRVCIRRPLRYYWRELRGTQQPFEN